jgi:ATP-dependent DNA helicase RecG
VASHDPYDHDDLETLAVDLESDLVERKRSLSDSDKIRQAICAFANDLPNYGKPGLVLVGLTDGGACADLNISDEVLQKLAHMRDDGQILPFPVMSVGKQDIGNCPVAVVTVFPSDQPPVRYNGRVWIRVGPRRAQASEAEERRLIEKRRWGTLSFDQQPAPFATLDDLDLLLFEREYLPSAVPPDILEANNRPLDHQLQALRFLAPDGRPNNAAVLMFGKDPLRFLPGAYVQFVRFDGTGLTDPVHSQHELSGPLSAVLRQIDELLALNITTRSDITGGPIERRMPDYPLVALQQLARNALMHRTYEASNAPSRLYWFDDRVEITSPGGPFGQVTPENFGEPQVTDYRNPLVAEAMKTLGFVQRFGIGIELARRELEKNGNPPPEFYPSANAVATLVRSAQ